MDYLIGKIGGEWGVIGTHCDDSSVELGGVVNSILFDKYDKVPNSYTIENGQFVALMTIDKVNELQYSLLVEKKVRNKYSISDELAILRQRDIKPNEYSTYNSYCEQCKAEARRELNL